MIKGLAAGMTNLVLALLLGATVPPGVILAASAVVGFLGIGVSLVMFMLGLRHLGTARTGAYFSLAPFIGPGVPGDVPGVPDPATDQRRRPDGDRAMATSGGAA